MLIPALVSSLVLASLVFAMLRWRAPRWGYLILGVLPSAALLLMSPNLRVYGYHGFIQAGIAYQILNGNLPPPSPLVGGLPGTYPWTGALVIAGLCKLLGISPFWAAALLAIASLLVLLIASYRIGLLVTGNPESSLFGTILALYAFTFTQSVPENPIKGVLRAIVRLPFEESRGAPILEKFNGCTAFPLGIALYALALLFLLRLLKELSCRWRLLAAFAASLVAVAFAYPYLFPSMVVQAVAVAVLAWRARGPGRRLALSLLGAIALAVLASLPYHLHLNQARVLPALQLISAQGLVRGLVVIVVTFLPMAALLLWARGPVREAVAAQGWPARLVLASVGMNLLGFAALLAPLWSQHNFLLLAIFALGLVGGTALRALYLRSWPVALAVLALLLVPFSLDGIHKARDWNHVPRTLQESGPALEPLDPDQRALYAWMRTRTDPRAVFVDTDLALPVYGQRALYVALPKTEAFVPLAMTLGNGYTLDPRLFMQVVDGYPGNLVDRRLRVAKALLAGESLAPADLADLTSAGSHAYLVLRSPFPEPAKPTTFPIAFQNPAATVIEIKR